VDDAYFCIFFLDSRSHSSLSFFKNPSFEGMLPTSSFPPDTFWKQLTILEHPYNNDMELLTFSYQEIIRLKILTDQTIQESFSQ